MDEYEEYMAMKNNKAIFQHHAFVKDDREDKITDIHIHEGHLPNYGT